jgi:RNA polymerase sigma factor (sigma-70 family)
VEYIKVAQSDDKMLNVLEKLSPAMEAFGFDKNTTSEEISSVTSKNNLNNQCGKKSDDKDLQELIYRIMAQDQSAFTTLFKIMSAQVNSLALRITDSVQLAEEVTEDTFFQVWRQAPRFDSSRGTVKAWILTIVRSRALDARRSIPPFEELPEHETVGSDDIRCHKDPPDLLSTFEQNHLLHSALETLAPLPRQLIALSFFRGLSHEEIADHAELPLGTVKSHIRRAVIHLREALLTPSLQLSNDHE